MKRALVTGANGFVGRAVTARLSEAGWHVVPAVRGPAGDALVLGSAPWRRSTFADAIERARPDVVFHLAGVTWAADSQTLYDSNVGLSAALLDAVGTASPRPSVVLIGSAAEYGNLAPQYLPAREDAPCQPVTDYGISKYAQTLLGLARARSGVAVLIARLFNPLGRFMPRHLALASFAEQLRAGADKLSVGDLDVSRDFIDVAEAARLIVELASEPGHHGQVFNICSGVDTNLRLLVEQMIARTGRSVRLTIDQSRLRPVEVRRFIGDTGRLRAAGLTVRPPDFARLLPELLAG